MARFPITRPPPPRGQALLEEPAWPLPRQRSAPQAVRDDGGALHGGGAEGFAVDASLIRAEANRQNFHSGEEGLLAELSTRAVDEYLAVLDDAAFGAASQAVPTRISSSDPASRYTSAHGGRAEFCYATNYLIDVDHAVIVDVDASTAVRQAEDTAAKRMIVRAHDALLSRYRSAQGATVGP